MPVAATVVIHHIAQSVAVADSGRVWQYRCICRGRRCATRRSKAILACIGGVVCLGGVVCVLARSSASWWRLAVVVASCDWPRCIILGGVTESLNLTLLTVVI